MNSIFISIHPDPIKWIKEGIKNHEFRSIVPKRTFDAMWVYETTPVCALKYYFKMGKIIKYPEKIAKEGKGNHSFNQSEKHAKYIYAYEILEVYELENPLPLKILKEKYQYNPPQSFAYDSCYPDLLKYLNQIPKKLIRKFD